MRTQAGTVRHVDGIILSKSRRSGAGPCLNNAPRPILIFVAARKIVSPAAVVAAMKNGPPAVHRRREERREEAGMNCREPEESPDQLKRLVSMA